MLVSGAVAGTVFGFAIGRDLHRLESIQIKWLPVLLVAAVLRVASPLFGALALPLDLLSIVSTAVVAAANLRIPGMTLIAVGSLLNAAVAIANSGMPVDMAGLAAVGATVHIDGLHTPQTEATALRALGDVLVLPFQRAAYSIGDVAIALGAFLVPFITLARR